MRRRLPFSFSERKQKLKITLDLLRAKGAWDDFLAFFKATWGEIAEYQKVLDRLAGKPILIEDDERNYKWALMLISKVGADEHAVKKISAAPRSRHLFAAGRLILKTDVSILGHILAADDIKALAGVKAGGGIRAWERIDVAGKIEAGEGIKADYAIKAGGGIKARERIQAAAAGIETGGGIEAGWGIDAHWGIEAVLGIKAGGSIDAGQDIKAGGAIEAGRAICVCGGINAGRGIESGTDISAGEGIKAGGEIKAGGGIEAGFSICCENSLSAKNRIFAGTYLLRLPENHERQIICLQLKSGTVAYGELIETSKTNAVQGV